MKNWKKTVVILAGICLSLVLCGGIFDSASVTIDTENKRIYKYCTADTILSDFAGDSKNAEKAYEGNYYVAAGKIQSIKKNGRGFYITGISEKSGEIECNSFEKDIIGTISGLSEGDEVAVYGKLSVLDFNKNIYMSIDKIEKSNLTVKSPETYYLSDGFHMDYNAMIPQSLNNGNVTYYIPAQWKRVEHNILEEELGLMEGYQYVLNKLSGENNSVPESFFVCYFDNEKLLLHKSDAKETRLIEKAIIENISDNDADRLPTKKVKTYYGAKYRYYESKYTDKLDINGGYHMEYVFQQDGDKGTVMYLYVYKEPKYLDDIMFVTRFLKIAGS